MNESPPYSHNLELVDAFGDRIEIADFIAHEPKERDGRTEQLFTLTIPLTMSVKIGDNVQVFDKADGHHVVTFTVERNFVNIEGEEFQRIEGGINVVERPKR